ncbi:hypothetical protein GF337_12615 [candidate division KSB1 bacterium]|nr:hypothetical protein [candidate division KSB1 bacterium]
MMKKAFFVCMILAGFLTSSLHAEINFPQDGFVAGWKKARELTYSASNLYGYINGGAELFLEFGFEELLIRRYDKGEAEISAEVYVMENPLAALGIYLAKSGKETPNPSINARNSGNAFQYSIVKNKYYVLINNFDGSEEFIPVMLKLAQSILDSIPVKVDQDVWKYLPDENRIAGSEQIIRGPFGLQPIYTFGEGDILQLQSEIFGYVADYRDGDNRLTQIVVPYPDAEKAKNIFLNLKENLDPYLKIVGATEDGFVFKDYQQKFGSVALEDRILSLKMHLQEKPGID